MKTLLKFSTKMRMMCADMRKKPTNITLSDEIKHRAAHVMQRRGFTSLSAFIEDLVRDAWEVATTPQLYQAPASAVPVAPPLPAPPAVTQRPPRLKPKPIAPVPPAVAIQKVLPPKRRKVSNG
jgi:hypothetical protein